MHGPIAITFQLIPLVLVDSPLQSMSKVKISLEIFIPKRQAKQRSYGKVAMGTVAFRMQ